MLQGSLFKNTFMSKIQLDFRNIMAQQYYEFIIIGAGIGGLQAAKILAENYRSFLILEASDIMGGRIATDRLGDVIKTKQKQGEELNWLAQNDQVMETRIDYGATWVSLEHTYMIKILQKFGIQTYPQYFDGLTIYGEDINKYERVESLIEYYKTFKKDIHRLLDKIDSIRNSFEALSEQEQGRNSYEQLDLLESAQSKDSLIRGRKRTQYSILNQYINFYDNLTVKDFIRNQLKNDFLADQILNEIEMLECISCDKFSMIQLFDDDGSLQLLKLYCEKVENSIDGMKIKKGMISVIEAMAQDVIDELQEERDDEVKLTDFIKFNSPVSKIENQIGEDVKVYIKNSDKVYTGGRILFTVPIAVADQVQITKISPSKKLIFNNQEHGNVTRLYLVFESAFWRGRYSGYGSFSSKFPFNEMTDLSPANLACGILVFIFIGDKYKRWINEIPQQKQQMKFLKKIIAGMYLNGNIDSPHLKNCMMYVRNFSGNPYIRAAYQSTTKPHIWAEVKANGDDYNEAYSRDQYNIIYIGSEFAEQHPTYMEGALRISRQKTCKLLGKTDPWLHLIQ